MATLNEIAKLKTALEAAQEKIASSATSAEGIITELNEKVNQLQEQNHNQVELLHSQKDQLAELDDLKKDVQLYEKFSKRNSEQLNKQLAINDTIKEQLQQKSQDVEHLVTQFNELKAQHKQLKKEKVEMDEEVADLNRRLQPLEEKEALLRIAEANKKANKKYVDLNKALMDTIKKFNNNLLLPQDSTVDGPMITIMKKLDELHVTITEEKQNTQEEKREEEQIGATVQNLVPPTSQEFLSAFEFTRNEPKYQETTGKCLEKWIEQARIFLAGIAFGSKQFVRSCLNAKLDLAKKVLASRVYTHPNETGSLLAQMEYIRALESYDKDLLIGDDVEKGKLLVAAMSSSGMFRLNVFIDTLSLLNLMQHTSFSENNSNDSQLKYLENPGDVANENCTSLLESFVNIMKSNVSVDVLARADKLEALFYVQRTILGRQYRSLRLGIQSDDQIQNVWTGEHVNGSEWILNRSSSERNRVLKQGISTLVATCIKPNFLDHDEITAEHLHKFEIDGTEHTVNLLYLIAYNKRTTTLKYAYGKFYKLFKK